jgi:hypothetical protein
MRLLEDSHVWSKFAYKRFVANPHKGGQFADLHEQRLTNKQYTRYWFCRACEERLGASESYASQLLTRIDQAPKQDHP